VFARPPGFSATNVVDFESLKSFAVQNIGGPEVRSAARCFQGIFPTVPRNLNPAKWDEP
jgi:hypothetical protein